jgi:branched-chain amino acid transport system permease protein
MTTTLETAATGTTVVGAPRLRALRWLAYGLLALAVIGLPWFTYPPVAVDILCWGLFAMGLDILLGYTGLLSFGHAAFWGGSAYVAGLTAIHLGGPYYVAVLVGGLFAMVLAVPIGWLSVRRSGIYFAMVTLAFAQMIYFVANRWRSVTGGENGLQAIPTNFFGMDSVESQPFWFYYSALPLLVLAALGAWRIVHSPFGRVLVAIRDNPDRARALGYDVEKYKVLAFVLSAGLSGIAGGLFTISHGFASLQEVAWQTSGKVVLISVLGGIGTLWGALAGSAVVVSLEDQLATSGFNGTGIILGGIFIAVVLLFRRGIFGSLLVVLHRVTRRWLP